MQQPVLFFSARILNTGVFMSMGSDPAFAFLRHISHSQIIQRRSH